jgi:hypothetical protein
MYSNPTHNICVTYSTNLQSVINASALRLYHIVVFFARNQCRTTPGSSHSMLSGTDAGFRALITHSAIGLTSPGPYLRCHRALLYPRARSSVFNHRAHQSPITTHYNSMLRYPLTKDVSTRSPFLFYQCRECVLAYEHGFSCANGAER